MIGNPKYNYKDKVVFICNNKKIIGTVEIIDAYGTFFKQNDVSYDIYCKEDNTLYKHVEEKFVVKKIWLLIKGGKIYV